MKTISASKSFRDTEFVNKLPSKKGGGLVVVNFDAEYFPGPPSLGGGDYD
jgi:hypothetical protein